MTPWQLFVNKWKDCKLCPLYEQRSNIVLARGVIPADIMMVGEAPGASEDALGIPFCGPAGHLLDQIVQRAVPPSVTVVCCNLVCCYPAEAKAAGYNEPEYSEILACRPRLMEFIDIAQPKLIVCVGSLASDNINHDAYGKVRGADVIAIIHPAAILRMPLAQKQMAAQRAIVTLRTAVEDMLQ